MATTQIVIVGTGNPYRGDDAVGVVFSRRIRESAGALAAVVEHDGDPAALMDAWDGADAVFLVDAVHSQRGGATERIFRFEAHDKPIPTEFFRFSTHAFGVAEAIELARALGRMPPRLVVFGIRGDDFGHTEELSPEVDDGCDAVVFQVLDEIREMTRHDQR